VNERLNVDTRHPSYDTYAPEWALIRDCVDGERAIKARGELYLPFPGVNPKDTHKAAKRYKNYKHRAAFLNATGRTLDALLGVAFAKPIAVAVSGALSLLENDTDGSGQSLAQLCRNSLTQVLTRGRMGYWVDYETPMMEEDGTQTAEQAAANRARVRLIEAPEIINWRVVDGVTTLVVFKIHDQLAGSVDDFGDLPVTKWIELRMVNGVAHARVWVENLNQDETVYARGLSATQLTPLVANGVSLNRLPFFWAGAKDNDATVDQAPLADIAALNIKHYCAEADVAEIAHVVCQPTLVLTGLTKTWADDHLKEGVQLGATTGIKLGINGTTPMAANILQAEERNASTLLCERRELQMAKMGAALVERGTAPKTATEAEYDAKTDNSILSLCVGNMEHSLNAALELAGQFAGGEATVEINKRYTDLTIDSQALVAMMSGVQNGTIRLIDFIKYLQGAGVVDGTEKPEDIETELRNQEPLPNMMALVQAGMQKDNSVDKDGISVDKDANSVDKEENDE